ncbi:MAG TPA: hypothetical protein VFX30_00020 [bacterium]|nr:hypothetical protein [bacterium]
MIPNKLTSCVIRLTGFFLAASLAWTMASCQAQPGEDQLHGMINVAFNSTAVCQAQQKLISFRNVSGEEIVIEGAAISVGTDPEGNFNLQGVRINGEDTPATTGFLNDIHVPAAASYAFILSYTPRSENTTHTAVMDIAYTAPKDGIIQVSLTGTSTSRAPSCPTGGGETPGGGKGDLAGALTITIDRIALVSSALSQPISTDEENTVTPYEPVTVPITFDGAANSVTLPTIGEDVQFLLPRTKTNPLFNLIKGETLVTTDADGSGSYSDEGEIEIPNVPIHLNECFDTHFTVTLTTGNVTIPNNLPKNLLRTAGFDLTDDQTQIFGSPISDELQTTLIGISTFTGTTGGSACTVAQSMEATAGAVIIKATIHLPEGS